MKIQERYPVLDVAFSPDGKTLAWPHSGINLLDIETRTTIIASKIGGNSISFSPDGKTLVYASSGRMVNVIDIETGNSIDLGHTKVDNSISFSPDSKILASGARDGTIKLWDVESGLNIGNLLGVPGSWVRIVAFSPDGKTIASRASRETYTRLWAVTTQITTAEFEHRNVKALTFSPDSTILASGAQDGTIKLWEISTSKNIVTLEHTAPIESLVFSPDNTILTSGARDGTIKLWDVKNRDNIGTFIHPGRYGIEFITFLSDGKILASRSPVSAHVPETVKLWHVPSQTLLMTFEMPPVANNVSIAFNNTMILKNFYGTFSLWDATTLTLIDAIEGFSPNGRIFASRKHDMILLGDTETSEKIVNTSTDFFLTVKKGRSYIHVPLKVTLIDGFPKTIESVGDLFDALGGASNVISLSTWDRSNWRWIDYHKVWHRGTPADKRLTDDMGIRAWMRNTVTIALQGDALGTNGHSTITLHSDSDIIGIPLKDPRIKKVSDLLSLNGVYDISVLVANGGHKSITGADDPDDMPLTGGQAFILYSLVESTVTISGEKWTNERSAIAAPSICTATVEAINRIETNLLPNYPNPFNPETWIPFRLAADANITLTIYDVSGRMVRTLDIGHSKAGIYESRDKAIYWDGRNDLGENVASGVYFYHLTAGGYSATRRLVILK